MRKKVRVAKNPILIRQTEMIEEGIHRGTPMGFPQRSAWPTPRKADGTFLVHYSPTINIEATARVRVRRDRGSMTNANSIERRRLEKIQEHREVVERVFVNFESLEKQQQLSKERYIERLKERNNISLELEAIRDDVRRRDKEMRAFKRKLEESCSVLYAHKAKGVTLDKFTITVKGVRKPSSKKPAKKSRTRG